jgi:MYXO-CTERM domain-containing protein
VLARYGEYGQDDGKLSYPSDIAYDGVRDWVAVADTDNDRVQLFEIEGTGGGSVLGDVRRGDYGPVWVCALPLAGLAALALLAALGRRRRNTGSSETQAGGS